MDEGPNRWLSYERLSLVRGEDDLVGIKDQHDTNVRAIEKRGGIVESYSDAAGHRSGRSDIHRPDWRKVLTRLEDPDVAGIVATFQDRLSRDVEDTAKLIKICERYDKHLIIPAESVDTTRTGWTPEVKLMLHIKASVAQHYADETAKKLRKRVKQYHAEGIMWGREPFGMKRVGKKLDTCFVGNDDAQTVVTLMTWYASNLSYEAVAEKANLTGLHFRDRKGRPIRFGREGIRTVVGNILFYSGYLPRIGWDAKNDRIELLGQGGYLERYARAGQAVRTTHITPIVSEDLANAVIERRYRNQLAGRKPMGWVPLLTPIAYYAPAGKQLRADSRGDLHYYRTRGSDIWIDANVADQGLVNRMRNVQFPPEARMVILRKLEERTGDVGKRRAQAEYDDAQARMDELVNLLLDKKIKREMYDQKFIELERLQQRARAEMSRVTDAERVLMLLSDLGDTIHDMQPEMRKRNLHRIFQRIDFGADGEICALHLREWAREAFGDIDLMVANSAEGGQLAQFLHPDARWFISMVIAASRARENATI